MSAFFHVPLFCKKAPEGLYLSCRAVDDSFYHPNTFQAADGLLCALYGVLLSDLHLIQYIVSSLISDTYISCRFSLCTLSEEYTRNCMLERNRYMVDKSDYVFAVWNGERHGGTWYTMQYANKRHKPLEILRLDEIL